MEWCCAKCGIGATADDWSLLMSMGWRVAATGEMRCTMCVRKEPQRFERPAACEPSSDASGRRELC